MLFTSIITEFCPVARTSPSRPLANHASEQELAGVAEPRLGRDSRVCRAHAQWIYTANLCSSRSRQMHNTKGTTSRTSLRSNCPSSSICPFARGFHPIDWARRLGGSFGSVMNWRPAQAADSHDLHRVRKSLEIHTSSSPGPASSWVRTTRRRGI